MSWSSNVTVAELDCEILAEFAIASVRLIVDWLFVESSIVLLIPISPECEISSRFHWLNKREIN
ncbi:MAG: hypothetical protein H0X03_06950 [Nitrosopumilus sp.]|nr:hypothetical protein [Nitrosopumilus sp.]